MLLSLEFTRHALLLLSFYADDFIKFGLVPIFLFLAFLNKSPLLKHIQIQTIKPLSANLYIKSEIRLSDFQGTTRSSY